MYQITIKQRKYRQFSQKNSDKTILHGKTATVMLKQKKSYAKPGRAISSRSWMQRVQSKSLILMTQGEISGFIGGKGVDGAKLHGVIKTSKEVLKTAVSPKKIAMYSAKVAYCGKSALTSGLRTFTAGVASNLVNLFRRSVTGSGV